MMTIVKTATAFHLTFKYRRKVYDDWSLHFIQWLYDKCHGAHALKTGLITGTRGTRGTVTNAPIQIHQCANTNLQIWIYKYKFTNNNKNNVNITSEKQIQRYKNTVR